MHSLREQAQEVSVSYQLCPLIMLANWPREGNGQRETKRDMQQEIVLLLLLLRCYKATSIFMIHRDTCLIRYVSNFPLKPLIQQTDLMSRSGPEPSIFQHSSSSEPSKIDFHTSRSDGQYIPLRSRSQFSVWPGIKYSSTTSSGSPWLYQDIPLDLWSG
jgi:hypothetical protein